MGEKFESSQADKRTAEVSIHPGQVPQTRNVPVSSPKAAVLSEGLKWVGNLLGPDDNSNVAFTLSLSVPHARGGGQINVLGTGAALDPCVLLSALDTSLDTSY